MTSKQSKISIDERQLKIEIKECRNRLAKEVSSVWIRRKAKHLVKEKYPSDDTTFTASDGWLFGFMRRHKIEFRKRKNLKHVSAEKKRAKIIEWHQNFRYNVMLMMTMILQQCEKDNLKNICVQ